MTESRRPDGRSRPTEALRLFGIGDASVRRIRSGLVAWHWNVRSGDRRLVLRRYNPWREDITYEHRVLNHLAGRRWPVAAPLPTADGDTLVDVGGDKYAL